MFKDLILELLSQDGYYTLNKKLVKLIGLENSFLLSFFIDKYKFFKEEFFYTKENILNDTRLTEYSLNSSLKFLRDNNLILIIKKGCPARNYYDINFKIIEELLQRSPETKEIKKSKSNNGIKEHETQKELIQENETKSIKNTSTYYNQNTITSTTGNNITSATENNSTSDYENLTTSPTENTTTSDREITPTSNPEINMTSDSEITMTYNKNKISKNKEVRTNKEKILKENSENGFFEDEFLEDNFLENEDYEENKTEEFKTLENKTEQIEFLENENFEELSEEENTENSNYKILENEKLNSLNQTQNQSQDQTQLAQTQSTTTKSLKTETREVTETQYQTPVITSNQLKPLKTELISRPSKKQLQQADPLYSDFLEISNRIKQLIESQKRINITNSQLSNWTTEISKLYKSLESARGSENAIYDMYLMINTLNADIWYEDKYKPVVESGKSFKEKFIKIEDYYKRRQMQYVKQKQEDDWDDLVL